MKKIYYIAIALIILILCSFFLVGCNKMYNLVKNNVSEMRINYYVGKSSNLYVSFITGFREQNYIIDGKNTTAVEFGVVSFKLLNDALITSEELTFELIVDGKKYDGSLQKNPYDNTFVADIQSQVKGVKNIIAKIVDKQNVYDVSLQSVIKDWKVDHELALKIACKELKNELETYVINGIFRGEVYVRIINNANMTNDKYFWYVNFVAEDGKTTAVIIDPITKEVLAKRN